MERIVDGKVVSLKHFLNKRLKGKVIDGIGHYALYTMVTYNNNNTQFKAFLDKSDQNKAIYIQSFNEDKLKNGDSSFIRAKDYQRLTEINEWILNIVEYEINRYKDEFSVKGLSTRLEIYVSEILDFINLIGKRGLMEAMGDELTHNNYVKLDKHKGDFKSKFNKAVNLLYVQNPNRKEFISQEVQNLYKVYMDFENFDFSSINTTCFDWISNEKIAKEFKNNAKYSNIDLKEFLYLLESIITATMHSST